MAATKIAYIQASWHTDITDNCKTAFVDEMQVQGYREHDVEFFSVPGSLEIPLMAKKLAHDGPLPRRVLQRPRRGRRHLPPRVRRPGRAAGHRQRLD